MKKRPNQYLSDEALGTLIRRVTHGPFGSPAYAVRCLRVSSGQQVGGTGLDTQGDEMDEWAGDRNVQFIGEPYAEPGESGWTGERDVMQQLIADLPRLAEQGVRYVAFLQIDRAARNAQWFLNFLDTLRQWGMALVSVTDPIDYSTPEGRQRIIREAAEAEGYSHKLSRTMKRTAATMKRHGLHVGPAPTGYRYDGKARPLVMTDAIAGPQMAFALYRTGLYSYETLAAALERHGHRCWSHTQQTWVRWNKWNVRELLNNPTYAGLRQQGGAYVQAQHEPAVDRATWDAVQALIAERSAKSGRISMGSGSGLLTELIYCEACQQAGRTSPLWHRTAGGRRYYGCKARFNVGADQCQALYVPAEPVEDAVLGLLATLAVPESWHAEILAETQTILAEQASPPPAATPATPEQQRRLDRLKHLFIEGDLSEAEYRAAKADIMHVPTLATPPTASTFDPAAALRYLSSLYQLAREAPLDQQRALLRSILAGIWMDKQNGVTAVQPREPYYDLVAALTGTPFVAYGEPGGGRTLDQRIKSPMLYH